MPSTRQVTAGLAALTTLAANACVWIVEIDATAGVTVTAIAGGGSVTAIVALPLLVGSSTLVAVIAWLASRGDGVYSPAAEIRPTLASPPRTPSTRQVTAGLAALTTPAANDCVWIVEIDAAAGATSTTTATGAGGGLGLSLPPPPEQPTSNPTINAATAHDPQRESGSERMDPRGSPWFVCCTSRIRHHRAPRSFIRRQCVRRSGFARFGSAHTYKVLLRIDAAAPDRADAHRDAAGSC